MKCEQCDNEATNSGSKLCESCENELMEDLKKQEEERLKDYYSELMRGLR